MRRAILGTVVFLACSSSEGTGGGGSGGDGGTAAGGSGGAHAGSGGAAEGGAGGAQAGTGGTGGQPQAGSGGSAQAGTGGAGGLSQAGAGGSAPGGAGGAATGNVHVYTKGGGDRITTLTLDLATGYLTQVNFFNPITIGSIEFSADRKYAYAAGAGASAGFATAFSVNATTGALTKIQGQDPSTTASGVVPIAVHPSGKWIFVPHFNDLGDVATFPINGDGTIGALVGGATTKAGMWAHFVQIDKSGTHVFVPCRGADWIAQYNFNPNTGALTPNNPARVVPPNPGSSGRVGPRTMVFHPTEKWAYVMNEDSGSVTSFNYNATTGLLTDGQSISSIPPNTTPEGAGGDIRIHPNGRFLYGSNRNRRNIAIFSLDQNTGRPTLIANEQVTPSIAHFTTDPTGNYLIVPGGTTTSLHVFKINAQTGLLTRVNQPNAPTGLGMPSYASTLDLR